MTGKPLTANQTQTPKALVQSSIHSGEDRLRLVLQSTQDGIWDWDVKSDQAYCSDHWKAMRGFLPDELEVTSEGWIQGIHPAEREGVMQALEVHFKTRAPFDEEYRVLCKDGSYIWVRDRGQAVWDEAGEVVRMVGVETDITDRKLAEEALKRQYQRSQLLSDITLKIRQSLSLDEILQTAVTEVQRFLQADRVLAFKLHPNGSGHVVQESVVSGWTATLGCDIVDPCFQENYADLYRQGRISSINDLAKSDIQPCHIELLSQFEVKANLVVPILFQNTIWGLLIAHQCSGPRQWTETEIELLQQIADQLGIALTQAQMFDQLEQQVEVRTAELLLTNIRLQEEIDDRLQAEELLRQSREKFRTLVTNLPQAVYRCLPDKDWTIEFISNSIASISGYLATDFIQSRVRTFGSIIYPNDRARVEAAFQTALAEKTFYHLHYRIVNAEGNICWIADQGKGIFDRQSGNLLYLDGTIADINDHRQAVQQLEISEAKYRALVETSESIIWSVDTEGRFLFINSAVKQIYGYGPEEMIGRLFFDFEPPQTTDDTKAQFSELFERGKSIQFERIHLSKIGQPIHLLFNAIALRNADGQVEAITGTASDITDLKWEESFQNIRNDVLNLMAIGRSLREILQTLTAKINQFLPGLHSTIMTMQADGQHLNSFAAADMPSLYLEAIDGLSIGPEVGSCGTAAYLRQRVIVENIATDPLWADYQDFILPYGFKACWSEPIKSDTNQVLGTFGMYFKDTRAPEPRELRLIEDCAELASAIITRKQSEDALRSSETKLRLTTDALPALIAYVDAQQCYQFVNQAYETWFGKPREQIVGHSIRDLLGEAIHQRIQPLIEQALSGHRTQSEEEVSMEEGKRFIRGTYIPDMCEGKVQGYFFLGNDITEQKRVERMKDEFISVVSHELRTPLTSIYGSLKLLATSTESDYSEDDQYMFNIAVDSSERLVRLINDVLDLERITSGKAKFLKQSCDAAALLTQAAAAMETLATEQAVTFSLQSQSLQLWADPDHIHQTLTNLLSNAIKFSPPGCTVWLKVKEQAQEIIFEIKDQGRGIPAHQLETIFERFQQVDASDSREKGGTGLGLAICQNIVQEHGGRIWAESILKKGSSFYFSIPKTKE